MGAAAFRQHSLQLGRCGFIDQQLARIGAAVLNDRSCLAPDQLGAAGAETAIAAKRQLIGAAVERAVAALHGLNAERVAGAERADGYGTKEGTEIALEPDAQAETPAFFLERFLRMEFEVARHGKGRLASPV